MKPRLLVVDADHSVCESLRKLLEAHNYEVYPARSAGEALEQFGSQPMDLVVLDLNLGADDGWRVFEAMTVRNPSVPTIIITGEWGQREQGAALGVEGLIEKPIDVPAFLGMIRELLAETSEAKLNRIRGNAAYCRYIRRHYEPYLRMLHERYNAPLRMASRAEMPTEKDPFIDPESPAVISASSSAHGGQLQGCGTRTPFRPRDRTTRLHGSE